MSTSWSEASLGEVAAINPRLADRPADDEPVSFVPMAGLGAADARTTSGELRPFGEVSTGYSQFVRDDLLVAKITPCFENGKIGRATIATRIGTGSTEFHVIRPDPRYLDASFALHFLRRDEIRQRGVLRMTGSAGQRRVPEAFLASLQIPLPSLEEQRRVARVLDIADRIRAQRRASFDLITDLSDSVFASMAIRSNGAWPLVRVSDLADASIGGIRTGPFGSQLLHSEFVDSGIAVLGIDNAVGNRFRWGVERYISPTKYEGLRRYTVHPGDVLITIMGTCGRVAVVPDNIGVAINTKHLCCISLDTSRCLPGFLHAYFLRHPIARRYLMSRAKGAIMAGLNMGIIKDLPVSLPPIERQQEIVDRLAAVDRVDRQAVEHAEHLRALFVSLEHRAFAGAI